MAVSPWGRWAVRGCGFAIRSGDPGPAGSEASPRMDPLRESEMTASGKGTAGAQADTALTTRAGLPASQTWLRELFAASPWPEHPNYAGLAAFWQGVHRSLRSEGGDLRSLLDRFRDGGHDPSLFQRAFSSKLQRYLGHLDFHHRIEDDAYFPRFRMLDSRLVTGFDLLETDHQIIHEHLEKVASSGERLLVSLRSPSADVRRELDAHSDAAERLIGLLDRHLDDEEDLVIPAILKHGQDAVS